MCTQLKGVTVLPAEEGKLQKEDCQQGWNGGPAGGVQRPAGTLFGSLTRAHITVGMSPYQRCSS